ncbi:MAG: hypothetical protein SF052_12565 [Bacteroidia bacterium]|nr:hypothetical protein [Bacteroidia bacterium]
MMKCLKFCLILFFSFSQTLLFAQKSLPEIEEELQRLSAEILTHDSLSFKIQQNKLFTRTLIETLKRPESFDYPFDSLKTISILQPEDRTFRIFTWHIVDKNYQEYYGEQYHYYFGLVQRRYEENGKTEFLVIPLVELRNIPRGVENSVLDNGSWLGALYYPPKYHDFIPSYTVKTIGYNKEQPRKVNNTLYLLLGWNGNDEKSNYKIVDVLSFDPKDKNRVLFGADIFYFDQIPKYRALFKYSEYAPFSLNFSYVQDGGQKKKMIVYDHMGTPKQGDQKLEDVFETGADGSYDALYFYKKVGYFEWYRNVTLAEKYISSENRKKQELIRQNQQKIAGERQKALKEEEAVAEQFGVMEKGDPTAKTINPASKKAQKQMLKQMEEQRKKEEEKLKQAGIKLPSGNQ